MVVLFMFKPKFFSILVIFLMVFSTVGSASATMVGDNVNDSHIIVVDNPTVSKIQKGIDKMIDFYLKKGYTLEWIEARIKINL